MADILYIQLYEEITNLKKNNEELKNLLEKLKLE